MYLQMRCFILLLLCLFQLSNSYSQSSSYKKVAYSVGFEDYTEFYEKKSKLKKNNPKLASKYNIMTAHNIDYELFFDETESFFLEKKKLSSDFKIQQNLVSILINDDLIYTNRDSIFGRYKIHSFHKYLKNYPQIDWVIKAKTKTIGQLQCIKAVGSYIINTRNGDEKIIVEAWYSPEIPIPWGPYIFSGLPGLIIEVKTSRNMQFLLTSFEEESKFKTSKPKGKVITLDHFNDLLSSSKEKIINGN